VPEITPGNETGIRAEAHEGTSARNAPGIWNVITTRGGRGDPA
jgi:hypothetical protein